MSSSTSQSLLASTGSSADGSILGNTLIQRNLNVPQFVSLNVKSLMSWPVVLRPWNDMKSFAMTIWFPEPSTFPVSSPYMSVPNCPKGTPVGPPPMSIGVACPHATAYEKAERHRDRRNRPERLSISQRAPYDQAKRRAVPELTPMRVAINVYHLRFTARWLAQMKLIAWRRESRFWSICRD